MVLVQPDGHRLEGADAIPEIAKRIPYYRVLTPLLRALLAFGVLWPAYHFVTRTWGPKSGNCAR